MKNQDSPQACRKVIDKLWSIPDPKTHHSEWQGQTPSHAGLILSRYLRVAVKDKDRLDNPVGDNDNIHPAARDDLFAQAKAALIATQEIYQLAFDRWEKAAKASGSVVIVDFPQRLVVGLGNASPLEAGLRLQHTYGVPVLPGSALKGLAAHYCDQIWGPKEGKYSRKDRDFFDILFGNQASAGCVDFHDAWLLPESIKKALQPDVMTPHHQDYYSGNNDAPPADWDSPVPVGFLSVTGKFLLAVQCNGETGEKVQWENLALKLLKDALTYWGIGGKTNAGYGRMHPGQPPAVQATTTQTWNKAKLRWSPGNSMLEATGGPDNVTASVKLPHGDKSMLAKLDDPARKKLLEKKINIEAVVVVQKIGNGFDILDIKPA